MKIIATTAGAVFLVALAARAQEAAHDPLSMLEKRDAGRRSLSPSTQPGDRRLHDAIERGLTFLDLWQSPNGSWDRLENRDPMFDSPGGWNGGDSFDGPVKDLAEKEVEHLADTCLSAHSMLLAVTSGRRPELSKNVLKAIDYVCGKAEFWNAETILMQTRVFDPIHDPAPASVEPRFYDPAVDTFFALNFLVEAHERIDRPEYRKRLHKAIGILLDKIQKRQDIKGNWPDETNPTRGLHTKFDPEKPIPGFEEAEFYNEDFPDVMTQCIAVKAINQAARKGFPVLPRVRHLAERYLYKAIRQTDLSLPPGRSYHTEPPDKKARAKAIFLTVAVATLYDADLTSRSLLADVKRRQAQGEEVKPTEIVPLEKHAAEARERLVDVVQKFTTARMTKVAGPALDAFPEVLAALQELAPAEAEALKLVLRDELLKRQRSDGHFKSGLSNADSKPQRGDNTFGTATTLRTLMLIAGDAPRRSSVEPGK
jgi:hypothetical protein